MPFLMRSTEQAAQNAEDVKFGPFQLPLPWLIPICIFSPFFLSLIIFVIYRYTIVRHRRAKQVALGDDPELPKLDKETEQKIQSFLTKPTTAARVFM